MVQVLPPPGLRAAQKTERRLRILVAARATFREKGYDGATTAEIAARAGVSIATLFAYTPEKRELLTAVFRAEMRAVTERSFARPPADDVVDDLLALLGARYRAWLRDVVLARAGVRESFGDLYATATSADPDAEETPPQYLLAARLAARVAEHQRRGRLSSGEDAETIARLIVDVYLSESRAWIAQPVPRIGNALEQLERMLRLALAAVLVPKAAVRRTRR